MIKASTILDMGDARQIALETLSRLPAGKDDANITAKKLLRDFARKHDFHDSDNMAKQKNYAFLLVTNVMQNYDSLNTELLACFNPADMAAHEVDMHLMRMGLSEIVHLHFNPRQVINGLDVMQGDAGLPDFMRQALWQAAWSRINDAVYQTLRHMPVQADNDLEAAQTAFIKGSQAAGLESDADLRRVEALNMTCGIIKNIEMLDDALDKYISRPECGSMDNAGRNILRIGLYEILANVAPAEAVALAMNTLAKKYQLAKARNFIKFWLVNCARSRARAIAFQILYALSFTPVENLQDLWRVYAMSPDNLEHTDEGKEESFAWHLIYGVWNNKAVLDAALEKYSRNWKIERIGKIELTLLRLGLYEILGKTVPPKVAILEILDLAAMFGVPDAKSFINGILDAAAKGMEKTSGQGRF